MKTLNPHVHIDDIPNYLIILTVQNKSKKNKPYMMAMYSERALKQNDSINQGKGFVCSVTNKKTFYLVNNDQSARLTEYNTYGIVFGKEEIKFIIGSDEI
jgi:hypothetical protein